MVKANTPTGVCLFVRSKPRPVQRSFSRSSLDIKSSVMMEKVWMFEGILNSKGSNEHLSETETNTERMCSKHTWIFSTNLLASQQCCKCNKRILPKRGIYRCTACRQLSHLKCVADAEEYTELKQSTPSKKHPKEKIDFSAFVPHLEEKSSCRYARKTSWKLRKLPEINNNIVNNHAIVHGDAKMDSMDIDLTELARSYEKSDASHHSQGHQCLNNMKESFVKTCRSIKKKVKAVKGKMITVAGHTGSYEKAMPASSTTTDNTTDQETGALEVQNPWIHSPVRARVRQRQLKIQRRLSEASCNSRHVEEKSSDNERTVVDSSLQMKYSKSHRYCAYDLDHLNDRLMDMEKRVQCLETAVPSELQEWNNLKNKFRSDYKADNKILHQETHAVQNDLHFTYPEMHTTQNKMGITYPKHLEVKNQLPSVSLGTTSDEIFIVPEHSYDSNSDTSGQEMHRDSPGKHPVTSGSSFLEDSLHSGIANKLKLYMPIDVPDMYTEHQTSTPVTNHEFSFRSSAKHYNKSNQICHTHITSINVEHYDKQTQDEKCTKTHTSKSPQKVLSPEQIAVKFFLERRKTGAWPCPKENQSLRKSSKQSGEDGITKASNKRSSYKHGCPEIHQDYSFSACSPYPIDHGCVQSSPPIASSTFREGNRCLNTSNLNSNMSPVSFTFRHDLGDISKMSYAGIELENSKSDEVKLVDRTSSSAAVDKNNSPVSNFSYTFRNDSQMIQSNADEDLQGYTKNQSLKASHFGHDNTGNANTMAVVADIEMHCPEGHDKMSERENANTWLALSTTSEDAMSLTNVTEFTSEYVSSFPEATPDNTTHSCWVNKEMLMFSADVQQRRSKAKHVISYDKIDETGDGQKPLLPTKHYSSCSDVNFLKEAEKRLEVYQKRKSCGKIHVGVCLDKLPRQLNVDMKDSGQTELAAAATYSKGQSVEHISSNPRQITERLVDEDSASEVEEYFTETCVKSQTAENIFKILKDTFTDDRLPASFKQSDDETRQLMEKLTSSATIVNSTCEYEEMEQHLQEESLKLHSGFLSKSLTDLYRSRSCNPQYKAQGKSASCANSIDGETRSIVSDNAKYHFLNDKGMVKISSPSLKLMSESPNERRKHNLLFSNGIDEESSGCNDSSSGISGVFIHNQFQLSLLSDTKNSEIGSKLTCSGMTDEELTNMAEAASATSLQPTNTEIQNNCLEYLEVANDKHDWQNHVLSWMSRECNNKYSLHHQVGMLTGQELEQDLLLEQDVVSENDEAQRLDSSVNLQNESLYYSFQGQSEDLRQQLSPLHNACASDSRPNNYDDDEDYGSEFMDVIISGSVKDVADFLDSDRMISEREIKNAVRWALEKQNFEVSMLLLEDICKLIKGTLEEDCVDVFAAYLERQRWQPIFVVLTKQNFQGEWDSFMGLPVYKRRYDLVSQEAVIVINSELVRNDPLSLDDLRNMGNAISCAELQKRHSKITVVNSCSYRSKNNGQLLEKSKCIVVHCLIKSFIPFDEEPFPKQIQGFPVDVREGYFCLGVSQSNMATDAKQNGTSNISFSSEDIWCKTSGSHRFKYVSDGKSGTSQCLSVLSQSVLSIPDLIYSNSNVDYEESNSIGTVDSENAWGAKHGQDLSHLYGSVSSSHKSNRKRVAMHGINSQDRRTKSGTEFSCSDVEESVNRESCGHGVRDRSGSDCTNSDHSAKCGTDSSASASRSINNDTLGRKIIGIRNDTDGAHTYSNVESETVFGHSMGNMRMSASYKHITNFTDIAEHSAKYGHCTGKINHNEDSTWQNVENRNDVNNLSMTDGLESLDVAMLRLPGPKGDCDNVAKTILPQKEHNSSSYGNRSTDVNLHLLMGASIGTLDGSGGTLGGFVQLPDGKTGFLTCAHVVGGEGKKIVQPAIFRENTNSYECGHVYKSVLDRGSCDQMGVDAAVVLTSDRSPVCEQFVKIGLEQLRCAALPHQEKFTFGKMLNIADLAEDQRYCTMIKVGAKTGLTSGTLYGEGIYIRQSDVNPSTQTHSEFFNQIEISSAMGMLSRFFDHGDSGALVFLYLDPDLHCVGMAIGFTSYGTCIVTPITNVFERLDLNLQFFTH